MLIGELLKSLYTTSEEDIKKALEVQKEVGGYLGQILIQTGSITEVQLTHALSGQLNIPIYASEDNIQTEDIVQYLVGRADLKFIVENGFVPVSIDHTKKLLCFVTSDPLKGFVTEYIVKTVAYELRLYLAIERVVREAARHYNFASKEDMVSLHVEDTPERLKDMAFEAPVIKYLNTTISRAVELNASDIHIEPSGNRFRVRFRIDGVLQEIDSVAEGFYLALVSRIKLLSSLDIAEKRLPQDGKFSTRIGASLLDIRTSTIPTATGEDVVIRLLYRARLSFDLRNLGLKDDHASVVKEMIPRPFGMILVTGPTGSGKTTTLYSILTHLNKTEKKIITIEDPVEYQLEGLNQIQVKSEIGLDFANALRSILRHDPDIIMVGEIRDRETARVSIQSALTGHLVLSTLHTNDAPSSLFRLLEMGLEDYLINASIIGVIAQRIVRLNCPDCSAEEVVPEEIKSHYKMEELYKKFSHLATGPMTFRRGKGCRKCAWTGYKGRSSIFEMFEYDEELKEIFLQQRSVSSLSAVLAERPYFRTLRQDGLLNVMAGKTTLEEILRIA